MKEWITCQALYVISITALVTTANAQSTNTYAQAVLADNPLVFYQFDEGSGATTLIDSSGNGNNAFYADVSLGNADTTSALGYAAGFNGSNSFVAVPPLGNAISLGGNGNSLCTIECWINPQSTAGGAIYAYDGWDTGALHLLWDWDGPGIQFSLNGNYTPTGTTVFNSNPPIPIGQWTYVAAVYDNVDSAPNVTVYVNGQVVGTNVFTAAVPVDFEPAEIGAWSGGGRFFQGLIDDFAIYTNVLSAAQIQTHYNAAVGPFINVTTQPQNVVAPVGGKATFTTAAAVVGLTESVGYQWQTNGVNVAGAMNAVFTTPALVLADDGMIINCVITAPGTIPTTTSNAVLTVRSYSSYSEAVLADHPVVYYRFEENSGATLAVDSSGNGNNGTYTNVSLGNASAEAGLGQAAGFDGSNSFVTVPALGDAYSLGGSGNSRFTIECWLNPQTTTGGAIYANPWVIGALNYLWDWTGQGIQFALNGNASTGTTVFDSNPPIPTQQWTYLVAVYEDDGTASNVVVYVNGQVIGTNVFTSALPVSFDPGQIGAQTTAGGRFFSGLIDDFAVYTNVLSAADVQAHYEAALIQAQPPALSIGNSGNGTVALLWNAIGFILQENTNLNNGTGWMDIPGSSNSPVNIPLGNSSMFYRLRSQ